MRRLKRLCYLCGKKFIVKVYNKGRYIGGQYFGKVPIPRNLKKKVEYWECDVCIKKEDKENEKAKKKKTKKKK